MGKMRKPSARSRDAKLDALCRLLVFTRDGQRCLRTGESINLQWAHVYSRRYKILRWDPMNSMCLSAKAHFWWHDQPLEAADWWETSVAPKIGTSRDYLSTRLRSGDKPDFEEIESSLKEALAESRLSPWACFPRNA